MDALFLSVLNMSLTGAFIIAAICLARLLLKKAPKIISYALWAVAGFRLIFPFSIESMFSLIPFKAQTIPVDIAMQPIPRIDSGITFINDAVSSVLPAATPHYSANPLQIWLAVGALIWFAGVTVMLTYGLISYFMLKRKMNGIVSVEDGVYESGKVKSPFVLGLLKPRIYMPPGLSEKERVYILLHEQTHIRRRDHIIKFAAYFVLCLHWFNPLAWLAFLLMSVDMEMSCDERVMKELGSDISGDYSMSLVRIASGRRLPGGSPLAFGEGGIKERVKRVLNFKKPSRIIIISAIVLVIVLSAGFTLNRISDSSNRPDTQTGGAPQHDLNSDSALQDLLDEITRVIITAEQFNAIAEKETSTVGGIPENISESTSDSVAGLANPEDIIFHVEAPYAIRPVITDKDIWFAIYMDNLSGHDYVITDAVLERGSGDNWINVDYIHANLGMRLGYQSHNAFLYLSEPLEAGNYRLTLNMNIWDKDDSIEPSYEFAVIKHIDAPAPQWDKQDTSQLRPSLYSEEGQSLDVTMSISNPVLSRDNIELELTIESNSSTSYNDEFMVDVLLDGTWYSIRPGTGMWKTVLHTFHDGEGITEHVHTITPLFEVGIMPAGQYRIYKSFNRYEYSQDFRSFMQVGFNEFASVEFTVAELLEWHGPDFNSSTLRLSW